MVQFLTVLLLFSMMAGMTYVPGSAATKMTAAVGFVLLAGFSIGELVKRIGLPSLLGYIIAGILFGPSMSELLVGADGVVTGLIEQWYGEQAVIALLGPDRAASLLPPGITEGSLGYIETLTVGVIGTLGGGELILDDLKDQIGTIIGICAAFFLLIVPVTAGAVYGLTVYAPSLVPFLQTAPSTTVFAVALLFGVFGFAMSPAATLAIIQETRSSGKFTSLVLGVVIVADVVLVASFLITQAFAEILILEGTIAAQPILSSLPGIAAEFGWALVIGVATGLIFIAYFRFVAREMLFFTVGAIFVASFICDIVHAEKLLAFLTAGFIVQNLSRHGHTMIEALESISMPAFVVYFTIKAAELNLQGIASVLALTGILTVIRTAMLYGGVNLVVRYFKPNLPDNVQDNLWLSFFSRGGVDLVLASLLASRASELGEWAIAFQNVIMGIVAIHLVVGPALLKFALDRAGDLSDDDASTEEPSDQTESDSDDSPEPGTFVDDPFPEPDFESPDLQSRVSDLRGKLVELHERRFIRPMDRHDGAVRHFVDELNEQIHEATDDLLTLLRSDDSLAERARKIRHRHKRFRQRLQPRLQPLADLRPIPVTTDACRAVLDDLRDLEPFESIYHVDLESRLLETTPGDGMSTRVIKWTRQLYSGLLGSMTRTVPLGRLWRFYIELSLPAILEEATAESAANHEEFWWQLGAQLRQVDRLFERVVHHLERAERDESTSDDNSSDASDDEFDGEFDDRRLSFSPAPDAGPFRSTGTLEEIFDEELDATEDGEPSAEIDDHKTLEARLARAVSAVRDLLSSEAERLRQLRDQYTRTSLEAITRALRTVYVDFLEGAEQAGTIQLPAFRYRPSIKFDRAQEAEQRLMNQLGTEQEVISGLRGWMVVDQEVSLFVHWFFDYRERVLNSLARTIRQDCLRALRNLQSRCNERPAEFDEPPSGEESDVVDPPRESASEIDWPEWLETQLKPSLQRTRGDLSSALAEIDDGDTTQRLLDMLERRVARLSEHVQLLPPETTIPTNSGGSEADSVVDLPLESWFMTDLIRETALRYVEFNQRAERSVRRSLVALEDIEQILEFNLQPDDRSTTPPLPTDSPTSSPDKLANLGLEHAARRVGELRESLRRDEQNLRDWVSDQLCDIARQTTRPLLDADLETIRGRLERKQDGVEQEAYEGRFARVIRPVANGFQRSWSATQSAIQTVTTDLYDRLWGQTEPADRDTVRRRLQALDTSNLSDIPVVYRRLFTPAPIDIPDFYIRRTALESECLDDIERWLQGESATMLVHGDRGAGKRTFLHHLLPSELSDRHDIREEQVTHLRLGRTLERPEAICRRIATIDEVPETTSLNTLRRHLQSLDNKRIVVIEDGENLLSRTPTGIRLGPQFFNFFTATSDKVLWIVNMGHPAVTLFDTLIDLTNFFTHTYEVGPIDQGDLRRVIGARHRVSGFHLKFQPPSFSLLDQLSAPFETTDAIRRPREAFFERLHQMSRGNPMLGLLYWLQSVRRDPTDETQFLVEPLPDHELDLLEPLSQTQLLIVATLVQHRRLRSDLLAEVMQRPVSAVETELSHLRRLGFVRPSAGHRDIWELRPFAEALTTPMLRERNLV